MSRHGLTLNQSYRLLVRNQETRERVMSLKLRKIKEGKSIRPLKKLYDELAQDAINMINQWGN